MPFGYYPAALDPLDVWDLPHNVVVEPLSIGQVVKDRVRGQLNFYDEFNYSALDADIWTEGGDAGGASGMRDGLNDAPTGWNLRTQNVLNNDWYWHGATNELNKRFTPFEEELSTVDWRAGIMFINVTQIQAFFGLLNSTPIVDYAEPVGRCAHFFFDTAIGNTFRCRSWDGGEEETDSTVVAVLSTYYDFRILWERTQVRFYIDEVLVATHAVQVPSRPMFTEFLVRTLVAGNKYIDMSYNHVEVY